MTTKTIGNGVIKILLLVREEDEPKWSNLIAKSLTAPIDITVFLLVKGDANIINELEQLYTKTPFIFILDLTNDGEAISGYGDRYLGIAEKAFGEKLAIGKIDDEYAKWYSERSEFSVLKIGINRKDIASLVAKILSYFYGR